MSNLLVIQHVDTLYLGGNNYQILANAVPLARERIIFSMKKNLQRIENCIKITACLWLDFLRFVGDGSDPYLLRAVTTQHFSLSLLLSKKSGFYRGSDMN